MAFEQQVQCEHAQWLASLATEHFAQQDVVPSGQQSESQATEDDEDEDYIVDISNQAVVKLSPGQTAPISVPVTSFNMRKNLKKRKMDMEQTPRNEDYKLFPAKDRTAKTFDMRRPVRPIDRQKMRPWLKNLLDSGSVFGLNWLQREDGIFQISWRHASRLGWNLETDGDVFERWARHTGIYKDGDVPEPKRWKANFRCALHSLPDVKELTSPTDRKGRNASRTYRFLRQSEVLPPVKRKQRYSIQIPYLHVMEQPSEDSASQHGDSDDNRDTEDEQLPEQIQAFPYCDHDYAVRIEINEEQHTVSDILPKHGSGFVLIETKVPNALEFKVQTQEEQEEEEGEEHESEAAQPSSPGTASPDSNPYSPQKKGNKTMSAAANKGKAKPKGTLAKDSQQIKKLKHQSSKEASPATKVSLKALLSGRKNLATSKRLKIFQKVTPALMKKVKGGKKGGKGKKSEGGPGTPTQGQGLQALLEAASQIESLDTATSTSSTPSTNTRSARGRRSASTSQALPSKAAPAVSTQSLQDDVLDLVVDAVGSDRDSPLTSSSSPSQGASPGSSPVSVAMLQQLLGLARPTSPAVPVTVDRTVVPAQTFTSDAPSVSTPLIGAMTRKRQKEVSTLKAGTHAGGVQLIRQPDPGTSMLKHLLRLTAPSAAAHSASSRMPTPIKLETAQSYRQRIASQEVIGNVFDRDLQSPEPDCTAETLPIGSEATPIPVSLVKVATKQKPVKVEEAAVTVHQSSIPVQRCASAEVGKDESAEVEEPVVILKTDTESAGSNTLAQFSVIPTVASDCAVASTAVQHVTFSLPQTRLAAATDDQTITVSLPTVARTALPQGHTVASAVDQPFDLMQFLNLCAAGGTQQVIIRTETVASDMHAMSSTYREESASSKFVLVDSSVVPPEAGQPSAERGVGVASEEGGVLTVFPSSSSSSSVVLMEGEAEECGARGSASGVEVVPSQFIMNEADISSLSQDQRGADCFVVDNVLLD